MPLSFQFGAMTAWQAAWLDTNFLEVGACTTIPCSVSGTNALTLTPLANTPAPAAYANYGRFGGIAANTNTGTATANVAGLGVKPVYKDTGTGPAALAAGDIISNTYLVLVYDAALNSGGGGFHLQTAPSTAAGTITGVTAGTGLSGGGGSGNVTVSLASVANLRIMANVSGGSTVPSAQTLSAILDNILSTTRGSVIYRGASLWSALGPGTQGQYLYSGGAGADPSWRGGVVTGISAAGATQGTATPLTGQFNQIASAGASTGVILDTVIGKEQRLWNDGGNTVNVYPPLGAQIDNLGTNIAATIAAGSKAGYVMISSTQAKTL